MEVADTSLAYDRGPKIETYTSFGVREVWVVDAVSLVTRVHRDLRAPGYNEIFDAPASETLRAASLAMCLVDLGLQPL